MTKMIASVSVQSVDDLYRQYGRLARTYAQDENPLAEFTSIIPRSSEYFVVVPREDEAMATVLMDRIRQRRKLRRREYAAYELRYAPFARSGEIVILFC